MSAPIKDLKVDFNKGLGFYPASLFIDFFDDEPVDTKDLYDTITYLGINDIIFRENLQTNLDILVWVTPRLISEGYTISVYSDDFVPISYNRIISTITHPNQFKKNIKFLSALNQNDIVILDVDTIDFLIFSKKLLIKHGIKAKIMFNSNKILASEILDNKIFDMFPL